MLTYKLDVFTGNLPNAGTNANVYVMLVGNRGDSCPRKLLRPLNSMNRSTALQQGQVSLKPTGVVFNLYLGVMCVID